VSGSRRPTGRAMAAWSKLAMTAGELTGRSKPAPSRAPEVVTFDGGYCVVDTLPRAQFMPPPFWWRA
jgi:hypothetical protein